MSHPALTQGPLTRTATRFSPQAGYLLGFACVLLGAAWIAPGPMAGTALMIPGLAVLALAFLVRFLHLRQKRMQTDLIDTVGTFIDKDACPSFATDADGTITYRNQAAAERFADKQAETLVAVLGDLFASPAAVLYRLQSKAQAAGSAREDVVLRRGHMRLSVHQVGDQGYLWRLEDLADRGPAGRTGENISLPMMTVSRTGTILFMNEALRRLLGGRETALDRVFTQLPVKHGDVVQIAADGGPRDVMVCEVSSSAGRRELYLMPEFSALSTEPAEWGVVDTLPVPLLKLDADGTITMANHAARTLLDDDGVAGTRLSDQVEGLGRPVSEWLREAVTGRHQGRSEVVRAVKPEEEVFLQISLSKVADPDGPVLVAVLQDATELKTLEAQFVQSQKMQAIGQLAGGIAHDFNNLLTAISGHCDLLLMRHDETEADYADLDQIRQNANRAAALVSQLLAFSRKQTLRPEIVDVADTLGDLAHLMNRLVGEKVQLSLNHGHEILPIRADKRLLEQVLVNLVVNARDAMPEGGEISIETANTILAQPLDRDRATVPAGDYVTIKVNDHGHGIAPDKVSKIFEPFYTTKGAKGTGLGLSMAYGIVKQTGGFIFADSVVGSGTSFTLYFPVCAEVETEDADPEHDRSTPAFRHSEPVLLLSDETGAVEAGAEAPADKDGPNWFGPGTAGARPDPVSGAAAAPPRADVGDDETLPLPTHDLTQDGGGIVLLVEDEAPVRAFASRALRMRGYTVLEAESAEAALKVLEDENLAVDVFVTDVIMPGMDGPTWVTQALEHRPGVKVVFVSGYAEDSVAEHQARIPNSVFLPKPFSLSELTATVQQQLH